MSGYAVLGGLGFFALFGFVIWLAMRSAKQVGIVESQNDQIKSGLAKDQKVQDILSEPVPDPATIIKRMRDNGF